MHNKGQSENHPRARGPAADPGRPPANEIEPPALTTFPYHPEKDTKSRCLHPRKTPGSNQGAGTGRALFASGCFFRMLLPPRRKQDRLPPLHQPGITPLTDLRLRLPGVVRPPFPPGRCHTARSPPAPAQTPGGRAPRGAAAPSPPAVSPSEDSRSRGTPPPADMTGSVLCHREGDVIIRVDRRVTAVAVDEQNPRLSTRNPRAGDRALPPGGPPGEQGGAPRDRGCDIRAAHEKKPFPVTPEQGLTNVRVCEAIYRSLAA